jgi:hypothetical protein
LRELGILRRDSWSLLSVELQNSSRPGGFFVSADRKSLDHRVGLTVIAPFRLSLFVVSWIVAAAAYRIRCSLELITVLSGIDLLPRHLIGDHDLFGRN